MDHFMPTFTVNYGLKIDFIIQFTISSVIYNSFILFKITKKKTFRNYVILIRFEILITVPVNLTVLALNKVE